MLAQFYIDSLYTRMATSCYPHYPEALCWKGGTLCFKGVIIFMENRKQRRWPFRLPLKKTGVIIFVVCLLSLSVASAATIHYISKPQSIKSNIHQTGIDITTNSQQSAVVVSSSSGNTSQSTTSASSADISVDFGKRQINTCLLYTSPSPRDS